MSYFFFLYRSPSSSLCTVSDSISSNIDEVLLINPSANVFVFGDFNIHHKDWLTCSGGNDRPGELCYNFCISNNFTQIVNFPTRIADCDSHSPALLDLFISSDTSICSTMAFPPLGNSDHAVVSVSTDFPISSKQDTPGIFPRPDVYSRKRWRRVQHIANEFWGRWRKEFMISLQECQKWNHPKRNFEVGDIVLLKFDSSRNHWPMARIIEVEPDVKGHVRSVKLKCGDNQNSSEKILRRPISKIVLLLENSPVAGMST